MENITRKEIVIGIAVTLIALAIAVFFEPFIKDGMMKEIRLYQDALQVNNDSKMFSYAQKTNVGNVLAFGDIYALEPQSMIDIQGSYMAIRKVKEHYTQHTRQVSHTSCSGSGKNEHCTTTYTTEIYYSWDFVQQWNWASSKYNFLDVEFQYNQLQLPSYQHLELNTSTINSKYAGFYDRWDLYERSSFGHPSGDDRYYFEILPTKFSTTIFVKFLNDKISDPIHNTNTIPVLAGQTPSHIIQQKKDNLVTFDWLYYILIILITIIVWLFIADQYIDIE